MKVPSTKTFGVGTAMDVWIKLKFDFERLKAARYSREQQYAALDCAIWSHHLIEWVLNEVDDNARARLTQVEAGKNAGEIDRFIATNEEVLRTISFCRQIANSSKHRVLSRSKDDPEWVTGHTVTIDPPFDATEPRGPFTFSALTYFRDRQSNEMTAVAFFEAVVAQWEYFLKREKLFILGWDNDPIEVSE